MNTLPTLPSALLTLAIDDLELAENSPDYRVDMGIWHEPVSDQCNVCLAGAVMAFSLDVPRWDIIKSLQDFNDPAILHALGALDQFRSGNIELALSGLKIPSSRRRALPLIIDIPDYGEKPAEFKRSIRDVITKLEEAGL